MTYRLFQQEGFHMHNVEFSDEALTIRYTHQQDSTDDVAVTKEVHISTSTGDQELAYWLGELHQAVEELVAHAQRHLRG